MRRAILIAAAATTPLATAPAYAQGLGTCRIADPTGTPLNVRQGPQGRVIGALRNGRMVRIAATAHDHKGQAWAQVVEHERGRTVGWVLREFVSCY